MPEYIIVEARSKDELLRNVNDACHNGFKPVGSFVIIEHSRVEYGASDLWLQPMFKE